MEDTDGEILHDFSCDRKFLMLSMGHALVRSPKYMYYCNVAYIWFIFLLLLCFEASGMVAVAVSFGDTVETIHTIHLCLVIMVILTGLISKNLSDNSLNEAMELIRRGVYHYSEETPDPEHNEIKKNGVKEIRMMSEGFTKVLCFSAVSNTVFVSLTQLLVITGDTSDRPLNPYLPQPFYIPFNTRTITGFSLGFLINIIYMFYLVGIVISMDDIFLSCVVQLKNQIEILNSSILKIEKRALLKLKWQMKDLQLSDVPQALYEVPEFQSCLYSCLRANVQHHQTILRLSKLFERYVGACLLMIIALASIIFAMHIVLILENPGFNVLVNFIVTLIAEMLYTLHYCWYGEQLITESSKIFLSLYQMPWTSCDKKFKQLQLIMMIRTKYPLKVTTIGFRISASLETFGSIISTMYQIMNVMREKKSE